MTANFIDFSQAELRNIVQDHNLHLMIKNYSKLTKSELVKLIETMLFIDSNNRIKIMPKILSKYNEHFKDITPGYIIVKKKFKKAPKEQPKQEEEDDRRFHKEKIKNLSKKYNINENEVKKILLLIDKENEDKEWQPLTEVEFEYYMKKIIKPTPKEQPKYTIKFKKNFGAPIIQLDKEGKKTLKKWKEDDKKAVKIENDGKPLPSPYKKKSGAIIDDEPTKQKLPTIPIIPKEYSEEIEKHKKNIEKLTKPTKPIPKMLENNEIEIKLTLEQIAKAIKSVKRQKPALEDRMLSILNRMADGQTKFKSFNEGIIKEIIDFL